MIGREIEQEREKKVRVKEEREEKVRERGEEEKGDGSTLLEGEERRSY